MPQIAQGTHAGNVCLKTPVILFRTGIRWESEPADGLQAADLASGSIHAARALFVLLQTPKQQLVRIEVSTGSHGRAQRRE